MSEFWSAVVILMFIVPYSDSVRCYMCMPKRSDHVDEYENTKLCTMFDASEKFTVDCPDSTMCVQSEMTLDMRNGFTSQVSHRYCAHQTETYSQVYVEGVGWRIVKPVHEIYDVGCTIEEHNGGKPTRNKICYCRGDLCNGGPFGSVSARVRKLTYNSYVVVNGDGDKLTTVEDAVGGRTDSQAWSGASVSVAPVCYVNILCLFLVVFHR